MKLTFLGTGDFYPRTLGHNSALLEFEDTNLVIDFPASNAASLEKIGIDIGRIKNVFISHLHNDHINGLAQFADYAKIYKARGLIDKKPTLWVPHTLINGLWESMKHGLGTTYNGPAVIEDYFDLEVVNTDIGGDFYIGSQVFSICRTTHIPNMYSYGIYCKDKFYFSCDSIIDNDLLSELAPKVKTIFHDCHLWDLNIPAHASLVEICALDIDIQLKIVLMHYNYNYEFKEQRNEFERQYGIMLAEPLSNYYFGEDD
jgi:ribonuclease BN (tRNA processing enzyme)